MTQNKKKLILLNLHDTVNLEFLKIFKLYSRIISIGYISHLFVKYRNGSHLNLNVASVHCKKFGKLPGIIRSHTF